MKGEGDGFGRKIASSGVKKFKNEPIWVDELTEARIQGGACLNHILSYQI